MTLLGTSYSDDDRAAATRAFTRLIDSSLISITPSISIALAELVLDIANGDGRETYSIVRDSGRYDDFHVTGMACARAANNVQGYGQEDIINLLRQICTIEEAGKDPAGAKYLILSSANEAAFRIAVCITVEGRIGWSLV